MSADRFERPRALLVLIAGYLVWASCFLVLYALLSLGCLQGWQLLPGPFGTSLLTTLLAAAWLLHLAAAAALLRPAWRSRPGQAAPRFLRGVTLLLHLSALIATLWVGFPLLLLPPCS